MNENMFEQRRRTGPDRHQEVAVGSEMCGILYSSESSGNNKRRKGLLVLRTS